MSESKENILKIKDCKVWLTGSVGKTLEEDKNVVNISLKKPLGDIPKGVDKILIEIDNNMQYEKN